MDERQSNIIDIALAKKTGRRGFMKGAILFSFGSLLGVRQILNPPEVDPLPSEYIDDETRKELLRYSPVMVFHNVMNSIGRFKLSLDMSPDYIDVDLVVVGGEIYASHNPYKKVPYVDRLIPLGPTGPYKLKLKEVAEDCAEAEQKMFLDTKNLDVEDLPLLRGILGESRMEEKILFCSRNPKLLDKIAEVYGYDWVFHSIPNEDRLNDFFEKGYRGNVSIPERLATKENIEALHERGANVFVYTVNSAQKALRVLGAKCDGIISENISLLNVYPRRV